MITDFAIAAMGGCLLISMLVIGMAIGFKLASWERTLEESCHGIRDEK